MNSSNNIIIALLTAILLVLLVGREAVVSGAQTFLVIGAIVVVAGLVVLGLLWGLASIYSGFIAIFGRFMEGSRLFVFLFWSSVIGGVSVLAEPTLRDEPYCFIPLYLLFLCLVIRYCEYAHKENDQQK